MEEQVGTLAKEIYHLAGDKYDHMQAVQQRLVYLKKRSEQLGMGLGFMLKMFLASLALVALEAGV